eukprot:63525_1
MPWYNSIGCTPPDWENYAVTIIVDYIMIAIALCCLLVTIYGTYRYVKDHNALKSSTIKPQKSLYIVGFVFFVVTLITLSQALIYDVMYLICPSLDQVEGPIYHATYFVQIFFLWIILFLRIYHIFRNSAFDLSKCIIRSYITAFICALAATIPIYYFFQFDADHFITLPYVAMSAIFSTAILITFIHRLILVFTNLGRDEYLLKSLVKHTILAATSISCTFLVIIVLIILYVKHSGVLSRHSVLEELILELFILIDIVSNFVCILLSYSFFDKIFHKLCGKVNDKVATFTSDKISSSIGTKDKDSHCGKRNMPISYQTQTNNKATTQAHERAHTVTDNCVCKLALQLTVMTETDTKDVVSDIVSDVISDYGQENREIEKELKAFSEIKPVVHIIRNLSKKLNQKKKEISNNDITLVLIKNKDIKSQSAIMVRQCTCSKNAMLRRSQSQPILEMNYRC